MTQPSNVNNAQEIIESAVAEQKPRRGCFGCLYCCLTRGAIGLLILAVPVWYFCLYAPPLRISKETTYVLGPLTADGKQIDYFRAFEEMSYPAEMKTDDNGYRVIVRSIGAGDAYNEDNEKELAWRRPQIYAKLGLDPNVAPTLSLISPDTFFTRQLKELDESSDAHKELAARRDAYWQRDKPWITYWSREDFPIPPEWLEQNTAGLDLLAEAVRKPYFCVPYLRENKNEPWNPMVLSILPDIQRLRDFARAGQGRATYRIGTGDIDGAIDDIITIYRLGRYTGRHSTLVSWLVGLAIEGVGASIDIAGNPASPPSREQLERLRSELAALPPLQTCAEAFATERLFGLACLQFQMSGQPIHDSFPSWMSSPLVRMAIDQNVLCQTLNKGYDKMIGVAQGTSDNAAFETWASSLRPSFNPLQWLTPSGRSEQVGSVLQSLLLPAVNAAHEAERRATCVMNLKQLTIALMLYEKDHGTMPDGDWREAIRPYLGENSEKYFRCPSHPNLAADETTYAMIRREDGATSLATPNSLLLVEVGSPMTFSGNDGTITEATARATNPRLKPDATDGLGSYHAGGYNTSLRGGGVRFFSQTMPKETLTEAITGEEGVPESRPNDSE
ncbi:MAG: DUF1559 domain-containing protein [Thermoguttaceae bacterium]